MISRKKLALLIAAGALLVIALVWLMVLDNRSPVRAVCSRLGEYGYRIAPGDLYLQGCSSNASIREVLSGKADGDELARLTELSRGCGFSGNVDKVGRVQLLMWQKDSDSVLMIYMTDDVPELAFIERISTGETEPIG